MKEAVEFIRCPNGIVPEFFQVARTTFNAVRKSWLGGIEIWVAEKVGLESIQTLWAPKGAIPAQTLAVR